MRRRDPGRPVWRAGKGEFRWVPEPWRSPGGLTGVAATSVLGSRLLELGWNVPGEALLVLAFAIWVPLEPLVARRLPGRVTGEWFMVVVAIQSLAVLSAELAAGRRLRSSAARWRSRRWPSPS
jgi:hypothetical protein